MTREEAIEQLKNIRSVPSMFIDEIIKELVEIFKQPPTPLEMLGWEDRQEYEWRGDIFRINSDILQVWDKEDEMWFDSSEELNDYLRLRQAKKVEPKLKAWHVKDKYSFNCLMKELNETFVFVYWEENYIYEKDNVDGSKYYQWTKDFEEIKGTHEVIEYHKEEPKYLLQTDLVSENGIQYLSFDKKRREYFIGALIASDNVQQKFTDDEITKIKLVTRFAKLCKKIEAKR